MDLFVYILQLYGMLPILDPHDTAAAAAAAAAASVRTYYALRARLLVPVATRPHRWCRHDAEPCSFQVQTNEAKGCLPCMLLTGHVMLAYPATWVTFYRNPEDFDQSF